MSNSEVVKRNVKSQKKSTDESPAPKYGPLPKVNGHRIWSRSVLILGILLYVWYTSKDTNYKILAKQAEVYEQRHQTVDCDTSYLNEIKNFKGCYPKKCGRYVSDNIVRPNEAETLLHLAQKVMILGGSNGGATILDLHSGALSHGDKFINVYSFEKSKQILTSEDLAVYKTVRSNIQNAVANYFGLQPDSLYLTHPTFFSRLNNKDAKTVHDEYWHEHVDKETYESFHYTTLVYLNDYNVDFKGGRFIFVDPDKKQNVTVEPRRGRVSMFTSGAENPHFVERVTVGTRFAITVSFTCDKSKAINDPVLQNK